MLDYLQDKDLDIHYLSQSKIDLTKRRKTNNYGLGYRWILKETDHDALNFKNAADSKVDVKDISRDIPHCTQSKSQD